MKADGDAERAPSLAPFSLLLFRSRDLSTYFFRNALGARRVFLSLLALYFFPSPSLFSLLQRLSRRVPSRFPVLLVFSSLSFAFSSFRSIRRVLCGTRRISTTSTSTEHLPVPVACETFLAVALTPSRTHRWKPRALPLVRTSRGRSLLPRHRRRTPHDLTAAHYDTFPLSSANFLSCFL